VIYYYNTVSNIRPAGRFSGPSNTDEPMNYESSIAAKSSDIDYLEDEAAAAKRKRNRLIIITLIAAAVIIIAAMMVRNSQKEAAATAAAGAATSTQGATVTVISPGRSQVSLTVSATGTLAARREMPVGVVGEGGMVTRVWVQPGTWVQAGQVLASIERSVQVQESAQLAAGISVAQADSRLAQSEVDRAQALVSRGFISKADLERKQATRDAAVARVRVAQAQLGANRARTGRLDIRAPEGGLVLSRSVEPGQVVGAGAGVLFRIAAGGEMELRAEMSEGDLARMSNGLSAKVTPVGTTSAFNGQIWQLSPVIDPQTRQGIARIALSYDRALRPGGFATAQIISGAVDAPLLPESAVQSSEKGPYVYIVGKDNKAERRDVTIGAVNDSGIPILSGLTGNELIVLSAGAFLNPGETIRPERAKPTN
jgi:HlyD family secretion protein